MQSEIILDLHLIQDIFTLRRTVSYTHLDVYKRQILGNPDVIHSTAYMVPELLNAKLVVTIHDLSFLLFPDLHTEENRKLLMQNLIYVNSRPDMVICDSEQTLSLIHI